MAVVLSYVEELHSYIYSVQQYSAYLVTGMHTIPEYLLSIFTADGTCPQKCF